MKFWRSNCFASFQEDTIGLRNRDLIGVDNLMFGSDYPHTESTFPRTLPLMLKGVTPVVSERDVGA